MNANATATATDLATLDRAALRTMYRNLCTEHGVEIDRSALDKATALRTAISAMLTVATEQVEAEPTATEQVEAEQVEAEQTAADLLAMVEQQVAAATGESSKRELVATAKFKTLLAKTVLAVGDNENGDVIIDADALLAAGWSKAYTTMRNGWGKTKPGGLAAAACGYTCTTRSDKSQVGGFVVVLTPAA